MPSAKINKANYDCLNYFGEITGTHCLHYPRERKLNCSNINGGTYYTKPAFPAIEIDILTCLYSLDQELAATFLKALK